jgi:hypothetical protein
MSEVGRRAFAGVWFAFLAVIPVAFFFLFLGGGNAQQQGTTFLRLFIGGPILLAGICGCWLGSSILDPAKVRTPGQAMLHGLKVALLAHVLFAAMLSLILTLTSEDPARLLSRWPLILIFMTVYIGWLVAIVGVVGGALLYMYRVMSAAHQPQE